MPLPTIKYAYKRPYTETEEIGNHLTAQILEFAILAVSLLIGKEQDAG